MDCVNQQRLETFNKRTQMVLANLGDVRGQLERGCDLQKSDGGFRMLDWMLSLGALYRNCLANVRKVEQNGQFKGVAVTISPFARNRLTVQREPIHEFIKDNCIKARKGKGGAFFFAFYL